MSPGVDPGRALPLQEGVSFWRWTSGLHVLGTRLWCDAARAHGVTFVSGADVVLRGRCERLLATERTQKLLDAKGEGTLPATFARPFALGRARLELLPAGRLPGSAQLRVEIDGKVLLYAGAVNPTGARLAEPAQVRGCDELVLEVAPPGDDEQSFLKAVREGRKLVVAESLWQGAEVAALLAGAGLTVRVPPRLRKLLLTYQRLGVPVPELSGEGREAVTVSFKDEPGGLRHRSGVELAALVEFAAATGARQVFITGGWSDEVAAAFASKKLRTSPIGPPQQVSLFS